MKGINISMKSIIGGIKVISGKIKTGFGKIFFLTLLLLLVSVSEIFSQPPPPPPPNIPIDGGIGWLIAAGVAYGAKKSLFSGRKKKE